MRCPHACQLEAAGGDGIRRFPPKSSLHTARQRLHEDRRVF